MEFVQMDCWKNSPHKGRIGRMYFSIKFIVNMQVSSTSLGYCYDDDVMKWLRRLTMNITSQEHFYLIWNQEYKIFLPFLICFIFWRPYILSHLIFLPLIGDKCDTNIRISQLIQPRKFLHCSSFHFISFSSIGWCWFGWIGLNRRGEGLGTIGQVDIAKDRSTDPRSWTW